MQRQCACTVPIHRPSLEIEGCIIPSSPTLRFLGILFDNELGWGPQQAAVLTKGQQWIQQVSRLAHPSKGAPGTCL
ncbi:hypothetical protein BDQ17DRAFT_1255959 [Cyathus striatus]|nr:hypothetical protein BDQ17DRAFT_1255959 [Cyathus striatus]